jgi:hypothetical protein
VYSSLPMSPCGVVNQARTTNQALQQPVSVRR